MTLSPSSQKAADKPISFVLHDMRAGSAPEQVTLAIRPEELTVNEPSRLAVQQTLGGAWLDNFGEGMPTINIAGHTGWRGADKEDGVALFANLHATVFKRWHALRAEALQRGADPDRVKLIFSDVLDDICWIVAPTMFVLKRNKARPLLSQYQIALTYLSGNVSETMAAQATVNGDTAVKSLNTSIADIRQFSNDIAGPTAAAIGPSSNAIKSLLASTASVLQGVRSFIGTAKSALSGPVGQAIGFAKNMARAAASVMATVASARNMASQLRGEILRVKAALHNAFCVLQNAFHLDLSIPNYDDLYGASTCSSTAGGRAASDHSATGANPFLTMFPSQVPIIAVSGNAAAAIGFLLGKDPIDNPATTSEISAYSAAIAAGVAI